MILLFACVEPDDTGALDEYPQETGVMITAPDLPAELAPEDVDTTFQTLMTDEFFLPFEIHQWFIDGLFADLSNGAVGCPDALETHESGVRWASYWSGTCTGTRYSAFGNWILDITESSSEGAYSLDAVELWSLIGDTLPDGGDLAAGGQAVVIWDQTDAGVTIEKMDVLGDFEDAAGPRPLQDGASPAITMSGTWSEKAGFVGVLSGPVGGGETAMDFDVTFEEGCASPVGTVRVRDPSSFWWEITLGDDCSGCGPLTYDGVEEGEACPGLLLWGTVYGRMQNFYENHR